MLPGACLVLQARLARPALLRASQECAVFFLFLFGLCALLLPLGSQAHQLYDE